MLHFLSEDSIDVTNYIEMNFMYTHYDRHVKSETLVHFRIKFYAKALVI